MSKKNDTPKSKKNDTPEKSDLTDVVESGSSKFGWLAALALLSIVGVIAWFMINGSDEI
ncbi:MAG: PLD nuclease N-terminal domain-containing protein [Acidimicrobiia bacterium]